MFPRVVFASCHRASLDEDYPFSLAPMKNVNAGTERRITTTRMKDIYFKNLKYSEIPTPMSLKSVYQNHLQQA